MPLKFHWRLPHGGETSGASRAAQIDLRAIGLPDLEAQIHFCHQAEQCGIDSLLTDFGFAKPDPILLALALGMHSRKIKFIVAYRSGLLSPAIFVQQLNTLSALINGRLSLNIVAGSSPEEQRSYGDFLSHDERYARTDEFLTICQAFWKGNGDVNFRGKYYTVENGKLNAPFVSNGRDSPEIFISGDSAAAHKLAVRQGTCWMRFGDTPNRIRKEAMSILRQGIEVGLRMSLITRPTREESCEAAYRLVAEIGQRDTENAFIKKTDSKSMKSTYALAETEWLTPCLWTGAVRAIGSTAMALVGTPDEIATAIMEYRDAGVSQFILSGWPKLEEMRRFGQEVLPLIREKEASSRKQAASQ